MQREFIDVFSGALNDIYPLPMTLSRRKGLFIAANPVPYTILRFMLLTAMMMITIFHLYGKEVICS